MTFEEIMTALQGKGTARNRTLYQRAGAGADGFGVSVHDIHTLANRLPHNQTLARQLWGTGNFDARTLAILLADTEALNYREIDVWLNSAGNPTHASFIARHLASQFPLVKRLVSKWIRSSNSLIAHTGYETLAIIASQPVHQRDDWSDLHFYQFIVGIECDVHRSCARTRQAMNKALTAIARRGGRLRNSVQAVRQRIGSVTPDSLHNLNEVREQHALPVY